MALSGMHSSLHTYMKVKAAPELLTPFKRMLEITDKRKENVQ